MHSFKHYREIICSAAAVILLYGAFALLGIGCPIRFFTGISCAGCGMTRALLAAARLDFKAAFYYHPLWWVLLPAALIFLRRRHYSKKTLNILLFIFIILFAIVYVYRMLSGDNDIVVFEPWNGLIMRAVRYIGGLLKS